jgi:beta-N-acetylhexosaminidase
MIDVAAYELTTQEITRLQHPSVGGVILFRRNYQSRQQITALITHIKGLRSPSLIVAVDHEGGRVQRFLPEFTSLPAMAELGVLFQHDPVAAHQAALETGSVLATELRACGVDLSFTPVLDLNWAQSSIIGNRSFHAEAKVVSALALSLQEGLRQGGMGSCGKHFPGHGFVKEDSHLTLPTDNRTFDELWAHDIQPFIHLMTHGMNALMPAHVIYPCIDADRPASFSQAWLHTMLREKLQFQGLVFSDDLNMAGASSQGSIEIRANDALAAGNDVLLICNEPHTVDLLLQTFNAPINPHLAERWASCEPSLNMDDAQRLLLNPIFNEQQARVAALSQGHSALYRQGDAVGEAC